MIKNCNDLNSGFTLIEVLVSIVLLSFLMIGVFTIIDNSTITKERVLFEDRESLQIETALARFGVDFSQIYSPNFFSPEESKKKNENQDNNSNFYDTKGFVKTKSYPAVTENGLPIPLIENPEKSTLIFLTSANRRKIQNLKESTFAWVKYSLIETPKDEDGYQGGLQFARTFVSGDPYQDEVDWEGSRTQVLMENVQDLEFSFWNPKRKEYEDSLKSASDGLKPIRIIKVKLTWVDSTDSEIIVERSFRSLWPHFDLKSDEKFIKENAKGTSINKGNTSSKK